MKHALLQTAMAWLCVVTAPPGDPMAAFYGNTVTVAVPPFYYAKRFVDPDGTWREPKGDGWIRGVWRLENGQICSWQTEPAILDAHRYCYAPVARRVGEEWITTDPNTGADVIQKIEPGRN